MKILAYDEVDKHQVLEINMSAFGWMLTPEQAEKIRRLDKRCPDYFALHAVENDEVLSQVGFVVLDTQTAEGLERMGFIWGVATKPSAARKGYAIALFEECHRRMLEDDIRLSFLCTAGSIVGYHLYEKLGYKDFLDSNSGVKLIKSPGRTKSRVEFVPSRNDGTFIDIFQEYSNGLLGFVHRPKNFIQVRKAWSWMSLDTTGIFRLGGKTIGYMLGTKSGKMLNIKEVCCPNIKDIPRCVEALEVKFKPQYMTYGFTSRNNIVEAYVKSGFRSIERTWGVFMVQDLKGGLTNTQIRELYGLNEDKFNMTSIDEY